MGHVLGSVDENIQTERDITNFPLIQVRNCCPRAFQTCVDSESIILRPIVYSNTESMVTALEQVAGNTWDVTESTTEASAKMGSEAVQQGDFSRLLLVLKATCLERDMAVTSQEDAQLKVEQLGLLE